MEFNRQTLLLLRGLPASGKSTFVKKHGLEDYVVSYDNIRNMIYGARLWERGGLWTPDYVEQATTQIMNYITQVRMQSGDFIVIDQPCIFNSRVLEHYLNSLKDLCDIYEYKLCYKEFDTTLQECLQRSKQRSDREPFPKTIIDMDKTMRENPMPSWVTKFEDLGYEGLANDK